MKYRKKPVVVEAFKWTGGRDQKEATEWILEAIRRGTVTITFVTGGLPSEMKIQTLEGVHRAYPGDYIIQDVAGELYPCKPDIFEQTYEEVENNGME